MTPAQSIAKVLVNDAKVLDMLVCLQDRYKDERGFEDLADYAVPLRKLTPKGIAVLSMKARPFAAVITIEGAQGRFLLRAVRKGRYANLRIERAS